MPTAAFSLTGTLTALTGTRALRIIKLIVIGLRCLSSERIVRAYERRNNLVLRVPLRVQKRLGFILGAEDHVVRGQGRSRSVAETTTVLARALARTAATSPRAARAAAHAVLAHKLRELRERAVQGRNIGRGMETCRKGLAEITRVRRSAAPLSVTARMLATTAAMPVTTTTMKSTSHVGEAYTLGQGTWRG